MSRLLSRLHPTIRAKHLEFDALMVAAGLYYMVTSTDRTIVEQMALFTTGRLQLKDVNRFRKAAGLYLYKAESENARPVTWTLESKHVTNGFDSLLDNDFSRAFDIAILKDKKPTWDIKVDVNDNELPDYEEAGKIWESLGGIWGGRFGDPAHMEI